MTFLNIKITSERLFRLLFHVLFWGMLIGWPIISSSGNAEFQRYLIRILPASLIYIPLFLLNTEWLIPRVLRKRGIPTYLLSLLALIVSFVILQMVMREWLLAHEPKHRRWDWFFPSLFVTLVTAVGTGYGFITYLVDQEKARQEEQRERLQSELSFLRSQISPHFIFNILNSIVYLIRTKSPQAEAVTIKLSELMRYMLYQSADTLVPLNKELEYVKNYVALQKLRFEEDVQVELQVTGAPQAQVIEPMLLIPFVENAFKHGVGMILHPVIHIDIRFDQHNFVFSVKNKIAPEGPESKDSSSGIGLRNVMRRLELLYPTTHQLTIDRKGEWFQVTLELELGH